MKGIMKKRGLLITAGFLLTIFFSANTLVAQESTAAQKEKEKEFKLQQAMDLQKKAMQDAKKANEDQLILMDRLAIDSVRGFGRGGDPGFYRSRVRSSGGNSFEVFDDPMVVSAGRGNGYSFFYGRGGDSERTTWDYSKQVKESTYAKDLSFDVEKTAKSVSMSLMGDCKSGQIRVKILMPNGKIYSDIVIDESGNLNWRKSFTITEEQNKDKTGEWKFKIEAEKATGYFKISLQTY
jgi:hypothetical protein